jgi:hypothetical protein
MPPFRVVNGAKAGAEALGIIVPPGSRTLVVLRPRGLPVDLVMTRQSEDGTDRFMEASRQTAGIAAQELAVALQKWAQGGPGGIEVVEMETGWGIQIELGSFRLIACPRISGKPYSPWSETLFNVERLVEKLRMLVCPPPDANQELYTNMSQFGR